MYLRSNRRAWIMRYGGRLPIKPANLPAPGPAPGPATGLAERKGESLHPRAEKLDLELPIGDGSRLSDQQIKPLFSEHAVALLVNIDPVSKAGRLTVDQHAKRHGRPRGGRSHDEVKIASMETKSDAAAGLV